MASAVFIHLPSTVEMVLVCSARCREALACRVVSLLQHLRYSGFIFKFEINHLTKRYFGGIYHVPAQKGMG